MSKMLPNADDFTLQGLWERVLEHPAVQYLREFQQYLRETKPTQQQLTRGIVNLAKQKKESRAPSPLPMKKGVFASNPNSEAYNYDKGVGVAAQRVGASPTAAVLIRIRHCKMF
jgi:hypothetical protein